jgi:hypothetical protein
MKCKFLQFLKSFFLSGPDIMEATCSGDLWECCSFNSHTSVEKCFEKQRRAFFGLSNGYNKENKTKQNKKTLNRKVVERP